MRASGINEAVTTLLLNYLAIDLMLFLIYDSWKDPLGLGPAGIAEAAGGGTTSRWSAPRRCTWAS